MRPLFSIVLFALLAGACGGSNGGPTAPDFPNIRGTYSGSWSLELREVSTGERAVVSCPGSVTVSSQSETTFSGSFVILSTSDCDNSSGTIEGTVRQDGGLTFTIDVPGGDPNAFEDITGCVIISGDSAFSGVVAGQSISFDASFTTDCATEIGVLRIIWTLGFDGSR